MRALTFLISEDEEKLAEEITLIGVISGKMARGDYVDDLNVAKLQSYYDRCVKVNNALHAKLNRVRQALDAEGLVTEKPEDEL